MWVYLGIFSAVFLGMYDVSRKHALQKNAVLPVLFFAVVFGAVFVLPAMVVSRINPEVMTKAGIFIPAVPWIEHLHLFNKAVIVAASWVCGYFALKHLPISIVSPIYVTGPVWTLIGAIILFHEHATVLQYAGFSVMVVSYYVFSVLGSKEGIVFHNNRWVMFALLATLIGAASGLYDKYLIHTLRFSPVVVQAWFSIYLVPVLGAGCSFILVSGQGALYTFCMAVEYPFDWRIFAYRGFRIFQGDTLRRLPDRDTFDAALRVCGGILCGGSDDVQRGADAVEGSGAGWACWREWF